MSRIIVPRRTFRLRDNPLLLGADPLRDLVCILIDEARIPSLPLDQIAMASQCMSPHQARFHLEAAELHARDLSREGFTVYIAPLSQAASLERAPRAAGASVVTDRVCDPAYDDFDAMLERTFDAVDYRTCATIVDWMDADARRVAEDHFRGTSRAPQYKSLRKLKAWILRHPRPQCPRLQLGRKRGKVVVLDDVLQRNLRQLSRLSPAFSLKQRVGKGTLSAWVDRVFDDGMAMISTKGWRKPDTARDVAFGERCGDPLSNASQLSPYLALGLVSALEFLACLGNGRVPTNYRVGDGVDQILFRECWHALGWADYDARDRFWSDAPGWWGTGNGGVRKIPPKACWGSYRDERVRAWVSGRMDWRDADESMQMLRDTGWIHHLRRHVVADALCARKYLDRSFLVGEQLFRHTLLDHDAPSNRANWLWLSANAFSTSLKRYHYDVSTYIQRGSCRIRRD